MKTPPNKLEGWTFEEDEISAGVYRVTAVDRMGRKVERIGTNPDKSRAECCQDIHDIQRSLEALPCYPDNTASIYAREDFRSSTENKKQG